MSAGKRAHHMNERIIIDAMRKILLLIMTLSLVTAQVSNENYILVKLKRGIKRSTFKSVLQSSNYAIEKPIVKRLGIYKVRIINKQITAQIAVEDMRNNPWVEKAQLDHKITLRQTFPDDNQFDQQWSLHNTGQNGGVEDADINAPEAWDFSTGGLNALGDTIVVAVVDDGIMAAHEDLAPNLWTNSHEISGNGIDDDHNGYVDDIHGWDATNSDGSIPSIGHGTHVAGIIGAKGNNGYRVAGVNWNVKLMTASVRTQSTSIALEAYGYILDQRALYDSTNGALGAFIVATNSSFGVDKADCGSQEYSMWNDMYNALGEYGILNATATMNTNIDVDSTGDVPTGCESDYIITVTNTMNNDGKNPSAAYGASSIDLGAPGTGILSAWTGGGTLTLTGTSFASPHVAGTVGLVHSIMSPGFVEFYKAYGAEAAVILKKMILDGTDSVSSLIGITVSGGRLNIYNTALIVQNYLAPDSLDPNPVANLQADTSQWHQITLTWDDPAKLSGGDTISGFVVDVHRDSLFLTSISIGSESFPDYGLVNGQSYKYSLVTRLIANDSTSSPAIITATAKGKPCLLGDVDRDQEITIKDLDKIVLFILGENIPSDMEMCTSDIDFDNEITIHDILRLADILQDSP